MYVRLGAEFIELLLFERDRNVPQRCGSHPCGYGRGCVFIVLAHTFVEQDEKEAMRKEGKTSRFSLGRSVVRQRSRVGTKAGSRHQDAFFDALACFSWFEIDRKS